MRLALGLGLPPGVSGAAAGFDPLSLSPLAWWPLDDGSGASARDLSGNDYDLTLFNDPVWNIGGGPGGRNALTFNGASFTVGTSSAAGLLAALAGRSIYSIVYWAKAPAYQSNGIGVSVDIDTMNNTLALYPYHAGNNGASVDYNGTQIIDSNAEASLDTWHMFAFVNASDVSHDMLVDKVSVGTSSMSETLSASTGFVAVGATVAAAQGFSGDQCNVFLFPTALQASELAQLYAWGS